MNIIQIILITVLIVVILGSIKYKLDILSPTKSFLLIWAIAIFLTEFKFSQYQFTWSVYSWLVLLLGLISFLIGNYVLFVINIDKKVFSIGQIRERILIQKQYDGAFLFKVIITVSLIYFIAFGVEVLEFGTIPILSAQPDFARVEFGVFGIHLLVNLQPALLVLCLEYLVLKTDKKKHLITIWLIFFLVVISYATLLQRYNFFLWAIISLSFLYYGSKKLTLKKIMLWGGIFLVFFTALQSIRLAQYAEQFIYITSKMRYSREYAIFTGPYMYIVMNLENFAHGVEKIDHFSYGILSNDWIFALTGLKHWLSEYFNIDYRKYVFSGYNTYPYLWDYFYDFGIIGVVIISFIIGFIIGNIYYIMRITAQLKWVIIYSFFLFFIVISFFTNSLTSLNIIINFFLLWIVHSYLTSQNRHDYE